MNKIEKELSIPKSKWRKIKRLANECTYEDDVSRMSLSEALEPYCNRLAKNLQRQIAESEQLEKDDEPILLNWPMRLGIEAGLYRHGKQFFPVIRAGGVEDSGFEDGWKNPADCFAYAMQQCLTYHLMRKRK